MGIPDQEGSILEGKKNHFYTDHKPHIRIKTLKSTASTSRECIDMFNTSYRPYCVTTTSRQQRINGSSRGLHDGILRHSPSLGVMESQAAFLRVLAR